LPLHLWSDRRYAAAHSTGGSRKEEVLVKRLLIGALLASAIAFPASAGLKQGDKAPDFNTKASLAGKSFDFSLKDALKKGPVVVYFYPAAFTGGCNAEAHAFAESADKFSAAHATIIGVSGDSIERLNAFSADPQYCAGKFPVASDADGSIGKSFDLKVTERKPDQPAYKDTRGVELDNKVGIERTTFVIGKDSKIVATLSSAEDKIKAPEHAEKSLAVVEGLTSTKH
jgi:peroxiredoxin Q/BCP